ncbi:unnamed protein product [Meloidogyne enterolobii]|uniref:Uncharacterized protein n=1 Tax=Meloidogyne enterolobii TaxID=390850 RepID=A0ACB1B2F1_MELEN
MVLLELIYAKSRSTIRAFVRLTTTTLSTNKVVGLWLLGCTGVVYESGLSMVKWDLIKTMKPPFNQNEWEIEFENYKKYPEYKQWGRAVGLIFIVPCTYFWLRGYFSNGIKRRMLFAGSLILAQGVIGWWMVKSGLKQTTAVKDDSFVPRVSQYRLVVHLSLAFILYGVLLWNGLSCLFTPFDVHGSKLAIFSTILLGAFVAGLDAGLVYNSWPKYSGKWIPHELMSRDIFGIDQFFSNPVSVQFLHRNLVKFLQYWFLILSYYFQAYLTLIVVSLTWFKGRNMKLSNRAKFALHTLLAACFTQAALGIGTLIYEVPISIASIHQNGALVLYSVIIWLSNEIRRIPK